MAEELQHLIEKIQREAVDTGEQQAAKIVAQAREKAAALIKDAEVSAAVIVEQARQDAEQMTQRGQQALAQSARDLLITIGGGVEKIFLQLVTDAVDQAMGPEALQPILARVVEAYLGEAGPEGSVQVLLNAEDQKALESFFRSRFANALGKGLDVVVDPRIGRGFKVRLRDRHIEHDFSHAAMAESVAAFLRPALAETVFRISREKA